MTSASDGNAAPGDGGSSTINVSDTTGLPASGTVYLRTTVGIQTIAYTGKTASTLTGCTGGHGTLHTGQPQWWGLVPDTEYWLLAGTQLAMTPGGSPIDIPAGGSGAFSILGVPAGPFVHMTQIEGSLREFANTSTGALCHYRGRGRPAGSVSSQGLAFSSYGSTSQNWRAIDYDLADLSVAPQIGGVVWESDHQHIWPIGGGYDGIRFNAGFGASLDARGTVWGNIAISAEITRRERVFSLEVAELECRRGGP